MLKGKKIKMNSIKFSCVKDDICTAIGNVSKAVSTKSTIPALEGIKLFLNGSSLELTGYDLEIGITTVIEAKSDDNGEIVLNSRLFSEIIRRMPSEYVNFEVDVNLNMKISGGNAEYQISAISADEYPAIPEISRDKVISINQETLKSMINQTNYAVSVLDTKPILTGELFDIENGEFNMVAIDGFRLAIRHEKITSSEKYNLVAPSKALLEASRLLKDDAENDCDIYIDNKYVVIEVNGYKVFTRLLEGEFHAYKKSVPNDFKTEAVVKTNEIIHCLERCSLLLNEKNKAPVKCSFEDGKIKVNCRTAIGKLEDSIPAAISGEDVIIGFNNKYFLDALKAAETDMVKIQMTGSNRAVKIVPMEGDSFTFIVMPVQIKN